jgi:hypothetical protein
MGTLTVIDSSGAQLAGVAVLSASCADVSSALNSVKASFSLTSAFVPVACTNFPVRADTLVVFQKNTSFSAFHALRVVEINAPSSDFLDYVGLSLIWTFGFVTVVALWAISRSAGLILESIRRF